MYNGFLIFFTLLVTLMLGIDLFVANNSDTKRGFKSNLIWSIVWISVALIFNATIFFLYQEPKNHQFAMEFLTAYLVEKSLSVDNLFVFLMIFTGLKIAPHQQQPILKW